jgi:large subunit ribosomal protein L13
MPTYIPKVDENGREWFVIDAKDQVLGKLATRAATLLTGKHKPIFTPFLDTGDHVIVINAAQVHLSGRKETDKLYRHHTLYLGGLKSTAAGDVRKKHPTRLIEEAVRGMLPKTKLGRAMFHKLKVYPGDVHPHQAQKPKSVVLAAKKPAAK